MQKRTAVVNTIYTNSITFSSIFNIGDTAIVNQKSKGIAVQKEGASFHQHDNIYFTDYPIFKREANWSNKKKIVNKTTTQHSDSIHVQQASLIGLSSSSIMQVGSINKIAADSRLKHFRKLQ